MRLRTRYAPLARASHRRAGLPLMRALPLPLRVLPFRTTRICVPLLPPPPRAHTCTAATACLPHHPPHLPPSTAYHTTTSRHARNTPLPLLYAHTPTRRRTCLYRCLLLPSLAFSPPTLSITTPLRATYQPRACAATTARTLIAGACVNNGVFFASLRRRGGTRHRRGRRFRMFAATYQCYRASLFEPNDYRASYANNSPAACVPRAATMLVCNL